MRAGFHCFGEIDCPSLIRGVVDFRKLWAYGRAEVSDESYVDTLDRLFYADKKPETREEF